MIDKPGIDGKEFVITLGRNEKIELIIGKDIEFIDDPISTEHGWKYNFKCISEKAYNYFNDIHR